MKVAADRLRQWLPQGRFGRSVLVLAGSTAFAQAVAVVSMPVLSRLYGPSDFGVLGLFASTLALLLVGASLRYEQALPLPEDEGDAFHLLVLSFAILLGFTGLTALVIGLAGGPIATWARTPSLAPYLWLLPIALLGSGAYQVLNYWTVRRKDFGAVAHTRVVQSVGQLGLQTGMGIAQWGALGLVLGDVAGRLLGTLRLWRSVDWVAMHPGFQAARLSAMASRYSRFPSVMLAASIMNVGAVQLPFLLVPAWFGLAPAGMFFLAYRILVLPMSMVSGAVGQVFYGEIARLGDQPEVKKSLSKRLTIGLFAMSIPLYGVIAIAGGPMFELAFGRPWREAGLYAQLLAPMVMLWAVASPISSLLIVGERFAENLAFTALELVLKLTAILVGFKWGSMVITALAFGLAGVALYVVALWRFLRLGDVSIRDLAGPVARIVALSTPLFLLAAAWSVSLAPGLRLGASIVLAGPALWAARRLIGEVRRHG